MCSQSATHTRSLRARLFIIPPQNMRCTDKPMIVQGAKFYTLAVGENAGSPKQRYIVEVDDIKILVEQSLQLVRFCNGSTQLMRGNEIEFSGSTSIETVDRNARVGRIMSVTCIGDESFTPKRECILVVYDMNVVPTSG